MSAFLDPERCQLTESSGGEDSPGHINPQKGVGQADNLSRFAISLSKHELNSGDYLPAFIFQML